MSARFVINDGQHRRAAIEKALEERPELGNETIAVVFYLDKDLRRSQQLFADLNKHAVRPTKSLGILYDRRDPLAGLVRHLARNAKLFKGLAELEKTSISNRSIKLFTLSAIYQATGALLGKSRAEPIDDGEKELAMRFWDELVEVISEWRLVIERKVSSAELRQDYVHAHAVTLHALGIAGHALVKAHPSDWHQRLQRLRRIDWSRSNVEIWEGRAMSGGQMSKAHRNVQATAILIKKTLGLNLTTAEQLAEARLVSIKQESASAT